MDGESASPEIVDEDNSPTASSTSRGSSGHDNNLAEPLEMEIIDQAAHVVASDETLSLEVNLVLKPKVVSPLQLHQKEPVPGELSGFIIPVAHISSFLPISISLCSFSFSLIHEVVLYGGQKTFEKLLFERRYRNMHPQRALQFEFYLTYLIKIRPLSSA